MTAVHRIKLLLSNAYLIEARVGLVLVDAGLPGEEGRILAFMRHLGRDDLRLIFITHAHIDHYGSAAALRAITGAELIVHEADGPAMAAGRTRLGTAKGLGWVIGRMLPLLERIRRPPLTPADRLLVDGETLEAFGITGRVLHTPGHTVGSSCLVLDERFAFSGDLVTNTGGPHLQHYFAEDWPALPESLERLKQVNAEWVFPGHGRRPIGRNELQAIRLPEDYT